MQAGIRTAFAAALGVLGAGAAIALAAPAERGFEVKSIENWESLDEQNGSGDDRWRAYKGRLRIDGGSGRGGGGSASIPKPPEGKWAAGLVQGGPGLHILHRVYDPKGKGKLKLQLAYNNTAGSFFAPESFEYDGGFNRASGYGAERGIQGGEPNQQLRIELIKPKAPLKTLDDEDILKTVFRTLPGDDLQRDYGKVSAKTPNRKFRLRIAEVDNVSNFLVGVDDVRLND